MCENGNRLVKILISKIIFEYIFIQINDPTSQTKLHIHLDDNLTDPDINFHHATHFCLFEPC